MAASCCCASRSCRAGEDSDFDGKLLKIKRILFYFLKYVLRNVLVFHSLKRVGHESGFWLVEIKGNNIDCILCSFYRLGLPHRVPLCDTACELTKKAMQTAKYGYLFPGDKKDAPLSNMAMLELLDGMGYTDITVHGFRSTFQDWAEEYGEYPEVFVDKAIAHKTTNKARRAYQRGDMLERRRKMMEHWSKYCTGSSATVVPFESAKDQAVA